MPSPNSIEHQQLLDHLRQTGLLADPRLDAAFSSVPRHIFLPDVPLEDAYSDRAIPIKRDQTGLTISSSSQPTMIAIMLNQLDLQAGHNVLEIGAGSGYNAALMHTLVGTGGRVTTVEIEPDLARAAGDNLMRAHCAGVTVVNDDGAKGYAPRAAYDRMICTAAIWDVPTTWVRQLKPNGILVAPIWLDGVQVSAAFRREADGCLYSENNLLCAFVYLRGIAEGPLLSKRIGTSGLSITSDQIDALDTAALHIQFSSDQERCQLSIALEPHEYWNGLMPYVMLNEPPGDIFALYGVSEQQKAYGIEGRGFALFTVGGAVLVPYHGTGETHCFAGADAFLTLETLLKRWHDAGRPTLDQLRLRLHPRTAVAASQPDDDETTSVARGRLYARRHHNLHAWLEEKR